MKMNNRCGYFLMSLLYIFLIIKEKIKKNMLRIFLISVIVFFSYSILYGFPDFISRRIYMSGCTTSAGISEEAQRSCYESYKNYMKLRRNGFMPS